jgi:hypothetical protein
MSKVMKKSDKEEIPFTFFLQTKGVFEDGREVAAIQGGQLLLKVQRAEVSLASSR